MRIVSGMCWDAKIDKDILQYLLFWSSMVKVHKINQLKTNQFNAIQNQIDTFKMSMASDDSNQTDTCLKKIFAPEKVLSLQFIVWTQ